VLQMTELQHELKNSQCRVYLQNFNVISLSDLFLSDKENPLFVA